MLSFPRHRTFHGITAQVEVSLHPGTTRLSPLGHVNDNRGSADIATASGWLIKHQQDIRRREGSDVVLPDFATQVMVVASYYWSGAAGAHAADHPTGHMIAGLACLSMGH